MQPRECVQCNKDFTPKSPHHLFCGRSCRDGYSKAKTWHNFFRCLINNNIKDRSNLTVEMLLGLLKKQDGRCALSGVELTKITGHGIVATNASIDRIKPSGPYVKSNIRLVCRFVNGFRSELSDDEFVWWCKRIVEKNA